MSGLAYPPLSLASLSLAYQYAPLAYLLLYRSPVSGGLLFLIAGGRSSPRGGPREAQGNYWGSTGEVLNRAYHGTGPTRAGIGSGQTLLRRCLDITQTLIGQPVPTDKEAS